MPSITSWTQLIPRSRDAEMVGTLSARILDPLWLLTRQWQVGEFQAEDAGTPVVARVRATHAEFSRVHLGEIPPNTMVQADPYQPAAAPLETILERRPMRATETTDLQMLTFSVDAGLHFLRMLDQQPVSQNYRARFIARFPLQSLPTAAAGDAAVRFGQTMLGRALDARRLAAAIRDNGGGHLAADAMLGIAAGDRAEVERTATDWLAWYDTVFSEPDRAAEGWDPARMEYSVSIAARLSAEPTDEFTFTASEIDDGRLDWASFDFNDEINMATAADRAFTDLVETTVPAPITFRGMPASRFWEMEDARIAYGLLPAGPTDLIQLMMIEYASSYGDDWFVVPLTLPIGSITRINSLVVIDTFGIKRLLQPIGSPSTSPANFSMWSPDFRRRAGQDAPGRPLSNVFFLPPTLATVLDGAVLEDVAFMRDEMANLAWAIERQVESPIEHALQRRELEDGSPIVTAPTTIPRYVLSTSVPEDWIPLVPVELQTTGGAIISRLKRGAVLQPDGSKKIHVAEGKVLNAGRSLVIYDEEVPREGMHITLRRRSARWIDGSTYVWTAFRRNTGRGEASSGLQFDSVIETQ